MIKMIKTIAAAGLAVSFASVAVAQSGPVDGKGQAGSVQQLGNGVTQGTNAEDAGKSRATMESLGAGGASRSTGEPSTGSIGAPGSATPPAQDSAGGPQPSGR